MVEKRQEIAPQDVFELLKLDAGSLNLLAIRQDQKHPGRRRFVDNVVRYTKEHNDAAEQEGAIAPKPEGYYSVFKSVLSSKTVDLIQLIEASKNNDFNKFVRIMKLLDLETLRRMGEIPKIKATVSPFGGEDVVPGVVKGKRTAFTEILKSKGRTAEDIRHAAARRRHSQPEN